MERGIRLHSLLPSPQLRDVALLDTESIGRLSRCVVFCVTGACYPQPDSSYNTNARRWLSSHPTGVWGHAPGRTRTCDLWFRKPTFGQVYALHPNITNITSLCRQSKHSFAMQLRMLCRHSKRFSVQLRTLCHYLCFYLSLLLT